MIIAYELYRYSINNPLAGLIMANNFIIALVVARVLYVLATILLCLLAFVGLEAWSHDYYMLAIDFGLDLTPFSLVDSSLNVGFTVSDTLEAGFALLIDLLPVAHADEGILDTNIVHSSFHSIAADKTPGGILLQKLLVHIHSEEKLGLPLYLTDTGIKASHQLIAMLNCLPLEGSSSYAGDKLL